MTRAMTTRLAVLVAVAMLSVGCGYNAAHQKGLAEKEMERGDYISARNRLVEVTQHARSDWESHYYLGLCHLELNEPVQAQTQLGQAYAVQDRHPEWTPKILDAMAQSLYDQDRPDELYAFLRAQIDRYGTWRDYARQARFLAKSGDVDGAALAYRKAAYFSKNRDADIYLEIAAFYEALGDPGRAVQALKWAYWINPQHTQIPTHLRRLGVVPGPTTRDEPPTLTFPGDRLFDVLLPGDNQ
ncbi:hypothetical protein OT109_15080 [Phycisphaeraceae bacterium D3-23]